MKPRRVRLAAPHYNCLVKRLQRILRAGIIVISLLLLLATATSWVRSYFISERLAFRHYSPLDDGAVIERIWSLRFSRGRFHFAFGRLWLEGVTRIDNTFFWSHRAPTRRDDRDYVK